MDRSKEQIAKGAALLGISAIIVKIIGVIYKVPLSYLLGDEGMGYFNSAYTVYTLFFILTSAGVPKAISIIISKNEAENKKITYGIMKTLSVFFFVIGILIFVLFYLLSAPISKIISNSGALASMYAIAPSIPLLSLSGVLRGYLIAKMSFIPVALSEVISGTSKLIFGLLLAVYSSRLGMSVSAISSYTIFGITLGSFLCLIPLIISVRKNKMSCPPLNVKRTVLEALKLSFPITLSSLFSGIAGLLDLTLVMRGLISSGYSPTVATAIYGNYTTLAIPMFALASTLINQIATSLLPSLLDERSVCDQTEKSNNLSFAMFLSFFIAIPCALFYFVFPKEILGILFEEGSVVLGYVFLSSVAPSLIFLAPLTIINTALEAAGKILQPVISLGIGTVIKLIVSAMLIKRAEFGILAASLGTFLSYFIPLIISNISFKKLKKYKIFYSRCIFIPLFSAAVSVVCGLIIRSVLPTVGNERANSLIFIAFMGLVYLVLSAILSKNQRKNMNKYVKMNKRSQ